MSILSTVTSYIDLIRLQLLESVLEVLDLSRISWSVVSPTLEILLGNL